MTVGDLGEHIIAKAVCSNCYELTDVIVDIDRSKKSCVVNDKATCKHCGYSSTVRLIIG